MAKLFIFAIGGTGSRVVKALTMLLAAGVKIDNTEKIIPIIIDPDSANGDLTRTEDIVRLYKHIQQKASSDKSTFFKTPICSLDELGEGGIVSDNFRFEIEGVKDSLFKDYIGFSEMDKSNMAMASLLFSKDNLDADMDVGFKGNPNIGSVVINKFKYSQFFRDFAQSFGENDRVFIISSIFGGTGAAGFPIVLKNIRGAQADIDNHISLRNSKIGAITIMPYFSINDTGKKTVIDSNTFISKTKAALNYYSRNVSGNKSLNAFYYIGDQFVDNRVEGADGAAEQKNNAHFIEVASAMAIVDFMQKSDEELNVHEGKVSTPIYLEYGLKTATANIAFNHLGNKTNELLAKPLTQFALFEIFFNKFLDASRDKAFAKNGNNTLIKSELERRFKDDLTSFTKYFEEWIRELGASSVAFQPLNLDVSKNDLLNLVTGNPEKINKWNPLEVKAHEAYEQALNETDKHDALDVLGDSNKKLLATFSRGTERILNKKITL